MGFLLMLVLIGVNFVGIKCCCQGMFMYICYLLGEWC